MVRDIPSLFRNFISRWQCLFYPKQFKEAKNGIQKVDCYGAKGSRGRENATHSLESKGHIYPECRMRGVKAEFKTLSY